MRKQMIENAACEVATQVKVVEATINTALAEIAEMQARLVGVSNVAGVSYATLQDSFEHMAAVTADMIKIRGTMAQCHIAFSEAKQRIPGLRTVAWGDCPEEEEFAGPRATTSLRAVA